MVYAAAWFAAGGTAKTTVMALTRACPGATTPRILEARPFLNPLLRQSYGSIVAEPMKLSVALHTAVAACQFD
jgi:hypothetical protein